MDNLSSLFSLKEEGFFVRQNNNELWNGVFGSRANTAMMLEWKKRLNSVLDAKKAGIYWTEVGNDMLDAINRDTTYLSPYKVFMGLDSVYPANWDRAVEEFVSKPYDNYKTLVREYQPFIVLVNSVYKAVEHLSEEEIRSANLPFNYFINSSLRRASVKSY